MKIVAVNGSHKGKGGNTDKLVSAFLQGAADAGAGTATVFLADKNIKFCRACKACWFSTPGSCVLKDDMPAILQTMADADVYVWATPLYFDNIASLFKTFIDRLMVLGSPHWTVDQHGECRHQTVNKLPKLLMIANCGFPERTHFQVLSHWLERHARNLGADILGEIYCSEGALLTTSNPDIEPLVAAYLQIVKTAGSEIATGLSLSKETVEKLAQPLLPYETYIEGAKKVIEGLSPTTEKINQSW